MENTNGTEVVGLVSRTVAFALAVVTTAVTSVGTAVLLTAGADAGPRQFYAIASAAVRATFGV